MGPLVGGRGYKVESGTGEGWKWEEAHMCSWGVLVSCTVSIALCTSEMDSFVHVLRNPSTTFAKLMHMRMCVCVYVCVRERVMTAA